MRGLIQITRYDLPWIFVISLAICPWTARSHPSECIGKTVDEPRTSPPQMR
jgi:hypothetical protein